MNIFEKIDSIIGTLNIKYYDTMPTFGEYDEPQLYIVYSLYDRCDFFGDGKLVGRGYTVTINVIGNNVRQVDELQEKVGKVLQENGFIYGGCSYQIDNDYPRQYRRIIDFTYQHFDCG